MAAVFQSFRSSSMPKRLLRYALSRLELLDAAALDMDNLDFAIGRNTVLEFRDVGIILPKLEKLLKLPSSFALQKAKVLLLRVTIPVDFYSSPISVEVEGVDVRLKIISKDEHPDRPKKKRHPPEDADAVPTAADLAQSFLETQPSSEKRRLEEAIAAETQDLGASVALSEPETEEDVSYGTGQALSLPVFLTDFLQGIVDRTQIRIRGLTFQLDVEVPIDANSSAVELVTFQLALEGISVEGVTAPALDEEGKPKIVPKEGKRHISLDNIRAFLISEANVFSTFARSPSMPSSLSSQSPVLTERRPVTRDSMSPPLAASLTEDSVTDSEILAQSHYPLQDSEDAFNIPYDFDGPEEHAGMELDPEVEEPQSSMSTPRASIYQDYPPHTPPETHAQSALIHPELARWGSFGREVQSEPSLDRAEYDDAEGQELQPSPFEAASTHSSSGSEGSSHSGAEDLALSHVYTHEEAESMYMSAFSQTESARLRSVMPGAWDTEDSHSPESSPREIRQPPTPPLRAPAKISPKSSPVARADSPTPDLIDPESLLLEEVPEAQEPLQEEPTEAAAAEAPNPAIEDSTASLDPEPQQEDVATPRGPAKLVKEIFSLQSVSVYIPSNHKHIEVTAVEPLGKSVSPNLPGAFSVYSVAASTHSPRSVVADQPPKAVDRALEIILAPLSVRFDASVGFLLTMVVSKLLEALKPMTNASATAQSTAEKKTAEATASSIRIAAEEISLLFLEKLPGVVDTPQRIFAPSQTDFSSDVLLRTVLHDVECSHSVSATETYTTIGINRFAFGYANDDIIYFDRELQMFESVVKDFKSGDDDISIQVKQSGDITDVKVNTLAVRLVMDLQRLDETFSWFGGLSGFLNMGTSMTSNSSRTGKAAAKSPQKPRGVRFDALADQEVQSAVSGTKAYIRAKAFRLDLVGKDCSVAVESSALKVASQENYTAVQVDRIRLLGPYLRNSSGQPPIAVEVLNTSLKYLPVPHHVDLEQLIELITPSKARFDEDEDEIMVDTLLRQRRKGPVLRLKLEKIHVTARNLQQLACLPALGEELARLGTVAKYLPEDDRPGLLTLGIIESVDLSVDVGGRFGVVDASVANFQVAHITLPSLVAAAVGSVFVKRNRTEELIATTDVPSSGPSKTITKPPVIMMRMIDGMEAVLKIKLVGLVVEYRVPTIADILDLAEDATPQDFEAGLAASVANLGEHARAALKREASAKSGLSEQPKAPAKPLKVDLAFRDCLIGLNPMGQTSKLVVVLTDAHLEVVPAKDNNVKAVGHMKKSSILLIDDVSILDSADDTIISRRRPSPSSSPQVVELCSHGFVDICQISSAKAVVRVIADADDEKRVEVELRDDLLVLETCADSTQTLIALVNSLAPPTPPSKEIKYRTAVVPVDQLLESISADAFSKAEGDYDFDNDFAIAQELGASEEGSEEFYGEGDSSPLQVDSQYYDDEAVEEQLFDATASSMISDESSAQDTKDGVLVTSFNTKADDLVDDSSDDLNIQEDYFGTQSVIEGTAHRWNSSKNTYDQSNDGRVIKSPLKVCVREVYVIWNLFDGYDWSHTRDVITKAVNDVETKAYERRARSDRRGGYDEDFEEEETVIGDFLFNSIYIGIPSSKDPAQLRQAINQELNDNATETESVATTTVTATPSRPGGSVRRGQKSLKLSRSKHHKITFELKGVNADIVTFPPNSGETQSSIDVRVKDLDIFDHVPTSTWKKFAMYDQDAGEREMGSSMVHLEILNVKPVPTLAASEIVLKVTVLPLRLHVDQDALDFITRFFEFKDDSIKVHASPSDVPFIQRAEITSIPVKLDFKPKRVDYRGLRSGRTTEFMNFLILEDARMVMRHAIIYGISGFDRLGDSLNNIWMPDIRKYQLPGILAGLAPVRPLVNVGSGFRNLIEIPIHEYRKDGRIVRSIGKGAAAFAKTTGVEIIRLGAKVAVGTQYLLQGAEGALTGESSASGAPGHSTATTSWTGEDDDDEYADTGEKKQISLYADQPTGVMQGLRGAYASLSRDLHMARDAIIAVPGEVMESQSAQGAAKAVLRRAPTIIFRPAIGATKIIGQTLLGATNTLDPENRRRMEAKYKRH